MNEKRGFFSIVFEIVQYTLIALAIVIPFRLYIAQPFIVSGASMTPTILPRDYLVIDVLSTSLREPKRGDVIIFRYPFDTSIYFVKRVIGLPGETVKIEDGVVHIVYPDGTQDTLDEPYVFDRYKTHESNTTKLDAGEYFVLGDNRSGSSDSRVWGPLQEKFIIGHALLRLYPFELFTYQPGAHTFPR